MLCGVCSQGAYNIVGVIVKIIEIILMLNFMAFDGGKFRDI